MADPAALGRIGLSNRVGPGFDPCGVIQVALEIGPGEGEELVFVLGQGDDEAQARRIIGNFANTNAAQEALEETERIWDERLSAITLVPLICLWILYLTGGWYTRL